MDGLGFVRGIDQEVGVDGDAHWSSKLFNASLSSRSTTGLPRSWLTQEKTRVDRGSAS